MATINGFTAEHMQAILNDTIVSGSIIANHLILVTSDGGTIDVGNVVGPAVGGTLGQVYAKTSAADYAAAWTSDLLMKSMILKAAASTTKSFGLGVTGETYDRFQLRPDRLSMAGGNRAGFEGSHTVGAVGIGSDNQVYIEGLSNVANLVHIQSARPGTVTRLQPPIVGSPTFPMTSGSVVLSDATEIPSTDAGPQALGKGYLVAPGFADDFNRADSASTMGAPWTAQGGSTWGISGLSAYCVSGGSVAQVLYDTGSIRHKMGVTLSGTAADIDGSGIIFNYSDASNYLYARFFASLGGTWNVYKVVAGVETFLFNAGTLIPSNLRVQAEYKDGIVSVTFGDRPPVTAIVTMPTGTQCGLRAPNGGMTGTDCHWDDFSVESEFVATWTGKSGNTLTGFTCTTATGTGGPTWSVRYKDGSKPILTRWSDPYGAPIAFMFGFGGFHVTDDISMGAGLPQDVGMAFGNTGNRTNPGLVLYGDAPVSGSGDDARKGMMLRRIVAGRAGFGGRLLIRPADITNSAGVGSAGTAADPHLSLGEVGNGLFFAAPGIGMTVATVDVWRFLTSGAMLPVVANTNDIGSTALRIKDIHVQGAYRLNNGLGASVRHSLITVNPNTVVSDNPGSIIQDSNGFLWVKSSGTGNTGWSKIRDTSVAIDYPDLDTDIVQDMSYRTIPVAFNLAQALTTSLAGFGAFDRVHLKDTLFTIPTGYKAQARVVSHVKGHNIGDVIGTALYDNPTAGFVIAETAFTTITATAADNVERVTSAWADIPTATHWQATIQIRNQTAARGTILGSWIETRFVPV